MERPRYRVQPLICATIAVLLGLIAFSCCIAAEFKKVKDKDIKLDGSLCSMPRRPAFGLGIAAIICLFISQIVGTSSSTASKVCIRRNSKRHHAVSITLLVLSWISFVLAEILLATASSMNNRQRYGRGWMNGECFVVKDGIFVGAAILAAANIIFTISFTLTTREITPQQTRPDEEKIDSRQQHKQAGPPSADAGSSCMEWKGQKQSCRGPT